MFLLNNHHFWSVQFITFVLLSWTIIPFVLNNIEETMKALYLETAAMFLILYILRTREHDNNSNIKKMVRALRQVHWSWVRFQPSAFRFSLLSNLNVLYGNVFWYERRFSGIQFTEKGSGSQEFQIIDVL